MAQRTTKSALIYGSLAVALFATCGICGTGSSTTPVVMATPAQEGLCQTDAEVEAGVPVHTDTDNAVLRSADPACPQPAQQPEGG